MDGRLRILSSTIDPAGAHFVLWIRVPEFAVGPLRRSDACERHESAGCLILVCGCRFEYAGLLFPVGLAKTSASPLYDPSVGRLDNGARCSFRRKDQMKLGFIALSGVHAHNPELMALGLTLPGFVERSRVIASLPSLGLLTIAALTPDNIEICYIEVPDLSRVDGIPEEFDVVATSSFTAQIKDAYALADRYRAVGTKVVLGGLHVTVLPDEALMHADAIVLGEGEIGWPQVVGDLLNHKEVQLRVYDGRGISFDLSHAPMPRHNLLDISRYNRLTVQTQRGCPFRCEFCAASILISPAYKLKPVDKVIAEIESIKSLWHGPFIEFADDNTFVNKKHSKQLLRALVRQNIRWFTETDLSVAGDSDLLALMRDSGCAQVLIGFESPTLEGLNGLEQRSNWKAAQLERYMEAIDRIQNHGVAVNGCFVVGLDGTGLESFDQIWNFIRQSRLYEVQITVQTAFPGTPLYKRLKAEDRIVRDEALELCTLFDVNFRPENMTVSELENGFRKLAAKLYDRESMYFQVARDPIRNRDFIPYGAALKIAYSGVVFWNVLVGGIPGFWIPWAWIDLVFLVLFLIAWNRTRRPEA